MGGTLDTKFYVDPSIQSKTITYTPTTVGDQATPIVPALAGKKIRVYAWGVSLSINGSNCYMKDSTGVQKTELLLRTTGGNAPNYYTRSAYPGIMMFETAVGASLQLNCTTAGATNSVQVIYSYV
jgi:hypothetical protein